MVNVYNSMLTVHALEQGLLQLGFVPQKQPHQFRTGPLQVDLLDAPRLRVTAPSGVYYIAVLSLLHLTQQLADL